MKPIPPQVNRIRDAVGWLLCWMNAPRLRAKLGGVDEWIEVVW
jgi:hypothetical protein